ncbi:hypothetical protein BAE44_0023510, partial [Dichanthelium oligosanthes]
LGHRRAPRRLRWRSAAEGVLGSHCTEPPDVIQVSQFSISFRLSLFCETYAHTCTHARALTPINTHEREWNKPVNLEIA